MNELKQRIMMLVGWIVQRQFVWHWFCIVRMQTPRKDSDLFKINFWGTILEHCAFNGRAPPPDNGPFWTIRELRPYLRFLRPCFCEKNMDLTFTGLSLPTMVVTGTNDNAWWTKAPQRRIPYDSIQKLMRPGFIRRRSSCLCGAQSRRQTGNRSRISRDYCPTISRLLDCLFIERRRGFRTDAFIWKDWSVV